MTGDASERIQPHLAHWPRFAPLSLALPATSVYDNLAVSARRFPDKAALLYYGTPLNYAELHRQVLVLAGYLTQTLGVAPGEPVLLFMQNAPQFAIAYYAILRADAVVVPVNPMNHVEELRHVAGDTGARIAVVGQELLPNLVPLLDDGTLDAAITAAYRDYVRNPGAWPLPDAVAQARQTLGHARLVAWEDALAVRLLPGRHHAAAEDPAVLVYSSGTTGKPKGCLHSHRGVNATLIGSAVWNPTWSSSVLLASLPWFHVTGMQTSMNGPLYLGATTVVMTRWDRRLAAQLIARHRVTHWRSITAMVVDFLADPDIGQADLSSLSFIGGGGAPMPKSVVESFRRLTGLDYVEGYGLSETMAPTHINPPHRTKPQCMGIPIFDVEARIVDPETLQELPTGAVGEIIIAGPQVFLGYWRDPAATAAATIERAGKRFLRTGDLGWVDDEGYFFLADRLKRMINAAGYKVWPTEVEALLYEHPAVQEACIVAAPDKRRGETVKAVLVLRPGASMTLQELQRWCRERMAAYKVPRLLALVDALPKSGAGKILWRSLQEAEWSKP
jgi:fatty-acyl-CoA synthase